MGILIFDCYAFYFYYINIFQKIIIFFYNKKILLFDASNIHVGKFKIIFVIFITYLFYYIYIYIVTYINFLNNLKINKKVRN